MSMIDFDEIAQHFSTGPQATQTKRYRTYAQILVAGKDMTAKLDPYLISILVKDGSIWEATVELDDRDARLDIPPVFNGDALQISLGWTSETAWRVFLGQIIEVEHGFGRKQGGRRMFIKGNGYSTTAKTKSPLSDHIGDGAGPGKSQGMNIPFIAAAQKFTSTVGLTASIGATFANLGRDYWSMNNESILQFFSRHANGLGAWWRIEGEKVVFNGVNDFDKATVIARWGDNLIGWRIRPFAARSTWSGSSQHYFEDRTGKWLEVLKKFGVGIPWSGKGISAIFRLPVPAPNAQIAGQTNFGAGQRTNWDSGEGHVIINGEPKAAFGGKVLIEGARPGVDGLYHIWSADHAWSRQGFVTTLTVKPDLSTTDNNIGEHGYGPTAIDAAKAAADAAAAADFVARFDALGATFRDRFDALGITPDTFQERFDALGATFQDRFNALGLPLGPTPGSFITSVVQSPDGGSTTTYYSDGTIKTVTAEGSTITSPDGSESFTPATPAAPVGTSGATGGDAHNLPPVIVENH